MQESLSTEPAVEWERISPILDEALNGLSEPDRHAIVWRFFEDQPLKEVGERLGLGESGTSRRISTALEKLRTVLARNGVTTTANALAVGMSTQAIQAAPAGLASTVAAGSLTTAVTSPATPLFLKSWLLTMKTKSIISVAVVRP